MAMDKYSKYGLIVLVIVLIVGASVLYYLLDSRTSDLNVTSDRLAIVDALLATTSVELRGVEDELVMSQDKAERVSSERDRVQSELLSTVESLIYAKGELARSEDRLLSTNCKGWGSLFMIVETVMMQS